MKRLCRLCMVVTFAALVAAAALRVARAQEAEGAKLTLMQGAGVVDPQDYEIARLKGDRQKFPDLHEPPRVVLRKVYRFTFVEPDPSDTDYSDGILPLKDENGNPVEYYVHAPDVIESMDMGVGDGITRPFRGVLRSNSIGRVCIPVEEIGPIEKLMADQVWRKDLWVVRSRAGSNMPPFVVQMPFNELCEFVAKYQNRELIRFEWSAPPPAPFEEPE